MTYRWRGKVPFDSDGNQLDYPSWKTDHWRDWFIFNDTLSLTGYTRGQNSAKLIWESVEHGYKYSMFLSDMMPAVKDGLGAGGTKTGEWGFCKKGKDYGIYLLEAGDADLHV